MNDLLMSLYRTMNALFALALVLLFGFYGMLIATPSQNGLLGGMIGAGAGLLIAGLVCGFVAMIAVMQRDLARIAAQSNATEAHLRRLVTFAAAQNQFTQLQLADYGASASRREAGREAAA